MFEQMKGFKNEMKKKTSENRELRKPVGAWENQQRDNGIRGQLQKCRRKGKELFKETLEIQTEDELK